MDSVKIRFFFLLLFLNRRRNTNLQIISHILQGTRAFDDKSIFRQNRIELYYFYASSFGYRIFFFSITYSSGILKSDS